MKANNKYLISFFIVVILLMLICFVRIDMNGDSPKIINIGLIFQNFHGNFNETRCMEWINQFNFSRWNFILWEDYNFTSSFVDFLTRKGLVIGQVGWIMQLNSTIRRVERLQTMISHFKENYSVTLKGFFMFQPDTYALNYAYENFGFQFLVGYCFNQYRIDNITERGGWQLPYYHNHEHALRPANDNKGLVVFPHVVWDWVSSLTVNHHLNTHILNIYMESPCKNDEEASIKYGLDLINESLSSTKPFGYACTMFEWDWIKNNKTLNEFSTEFYLQVINNYGPIAQMYNDTAL